MLTSGYSHLRKLFFSCFLYNENMKSHLLLTARILGSYAAILAFVHGFFEIQQGSLMVEGIGINAIGNHCVADQIWHACFPAITIWPTYFSAGLITIILSIILFLFVLLYPQNHISGWVILAFAAGILLSGGGFIPTFTAIMSAVAILINRNQKPVSGKNHKSFIVLWIILLSVYVIYAAGGWIFGNFFNSFMVSNSFILFFSMHILTPILGIIFARLADRRNA